MRHFLAQVYVSCYHSLEIRFAFNLHSVSKWGKNDDKMFEFTQQFVVLFVHHRDNASQSISVVGEKIVVFFFSGSISQDLNRIGIFVIGRKCYNLSLFMRVLKVDLREKNLGRFSRSFEMVLKFFVKSNFTFCNSKFDGILELLNGFNFNILSFCFN